MSTTKSFTASQLRLVRRCQVRLVAFCAHTLPSSRETVNPLRAGIHVETDETSEHRVKGIKTGARVLSDYLVDWRLQRRTERLSQDQREPSIRHIAPQLVDSPLERVADVRPNPRRSRYERKASRDAVMAFATMRIAPKSQFPDHSRRRMHHRYWQRTAR
jgi:hypothetical protein